MHCGFTERELAAFPEEWAKVIRMRAEGRSSAEIKRETGVFVYQQAWLAEDARRELEERGLEALEREQAEVRRDRAERAELDVLPNVARNCLVRNGYGSAVRVRAATDQELLALRNFGVANLRYVRQHFPYEGDA